MAKTGFQKAYFENKKQKQRKKISIGLVSKVTILAVVLIVGSVLTFSKPIQNQIVSYASNTDNHSIVDVSREQVLENEKEIENANFDFSEVKELDLPTVVKASTKAKQTQQKIVAGLAIPSVGISESIYLGVSNYVLGICVGTMKKEQKLGEGNYALAGHTMNNQSLLLGPLVNIKKGDQVYVTDLEYMYTYQVSYKGKVSAKDVQVIEDQEGRTMLTLVTCANKGKKRLVVQADFVEKTAINQVSSSVLQYFK